MPGDREKRGLLQVPVEHIDPTAFDAVLLVEAMGRTAFQARNLARACEVYHQMLDDRDCTIVLCLAGSLVSAGLGRTIAVLLEHGMTDAVVATGANIVDQD
ncbi:TPA: deoxyhypusine synthase, partial [Candidatus Acetothermia bacterium]|nr:deoxyhypusine synthase [Candidatus Acetothermia bacterium]